jgi:tRNA(Ile)-lysidine synthetase-like protein
MKITVKPGKYVAAVSGGVDSMVLLHLLHLTSDAQLVVAHLDHGIRRDAWQDRVLVASTAEAYGLPFEYKEARLGPAASEAEARSIRYAFLETVRQGYGAQAIITAHHQDDVLETAFLNLLRGTGRKGLSSLRSSDTVVRPLLHIPKQDIRSYAIEHDIRWREDSTNQDEHYLRNYVRRQLLTKLSAEQKQQFADRLRIASDINRELDSLLDDMLTLHQTIEGLDRQWFIALPYDVSTEIMASWLRSSEIRDFDRKAIARLVVAAKTAQSGKRIDIVAANQLHIGKHYLNLARR